MSGRARPKVQFIERYDDGLFIISLDEFIMRSSEYFNQSGIFQTYENHNGYEGLEFSDSFVDFLRERGYTSIVEAHERGIAMGHLLNSLRLTRAHVVELKLTLL